MPRHNLDSVVGQMEEVPRLPGVVSQLLSLFKDAQAGTADIKRVLAFDPELSARVVTVAQGIAERTGKSVPDLNMAVNFLGFESVKSIVLLVGVMQAFPDQDGALRFQNHRFWRHSFAAGIAYRYLARKEEWDLDHAFLCGLLHDLGKLILNRTVPQEVEQLLIMAERTGSFMHHVESLVLDTHHGEVGAWLAQEWGVSEEIVYFIFNHHKNKPVEGDKTYPIAVLADFMLSELGLSSPGSFGDAECDPQIWLELSVSQDNLRQMYRELKQELAIVSYVVPNQDAV